MGVRLMRHRAMEPEPSKADNDKVIPKSNSGSLGGYGIPADEEFLSVII